MVEPCKVCGSSLCMCPLDDETLRLLYGDPTAPEPQDVIEASKRERRAEPVTPSKRLKKVRKREGRQ